MYIGKEILIVIELKMSDQIKDILQKGKSKNASDTERMEMLSLFHKLEVKDDVKHKLQEEIETLEINETDLPDFKKIFARLWRKIEQNNLNPKLKTRYLSSFVKIAAALILGLFIGVYTSSLKVKEKEPEYYAAHSPKGSVSEMILPDGSVIFLNADSRIKYSMQGEKGIREVFLDGEAWFEVAKNKEKPFVVHTNSYKVSVIGTQFNIKAYGSEKEVVTTLEEGSVAIQSGNNFKFIEDKVLKPGEQLIFNTETREALIKTVNTKRFTSWKDNKLIFINMELKDLIVLLERKYGVEIEVINKEILDLHFDGTLKNESIIEILDILKKTLPLEYNIVGQKIEITRKQN